MPLVFAPFSASSFHFVSSLLFAFPVFPFIHLLLSFPLVLDLFRALSIVRIISYLAHLFVLWLPFVSCVIPSVFYLEDILFV